MARNDAAHGIPSTFETVHAPQLYQTPNLTLDTGRPSANPQDAAIQKILGDAVDVRYNDHSLGIYGSAPRTETSLPLSVQGRAVVIETKIFMNLLESNDPINGLMSVENTNCLKIFYSEENLIGGMVEETAEKGPANVLAIDTQVRERDMKRYGLDTRGNMNAFLPDNKEYERTQRNINAVIFAFQQYHAMLGWQELVTHSVNIIDALQRIKPKNIRGRSALEVLQERTEIRDDVLFGALTTNENALTDMMNLASRLQLNPLMEQDGTDPNRQYDTVVVPPGTIAKDKLLRAQGYYTMAGIPSGEGTASYTREIPNLFEEKSTHLRVIQHRPRINIAGAGGMRDGEVEMGDLSRNTAVCTYYPVPLKETVIDDRPNLVHEPDVVEREDNVGDDAENEGVQILYDAADVQITDFVRKTWKTIKISRNTLRQYKHVYDEVYNGRNPYMQYINDDGTLNERVMKQEGVGLCLVRPDMVLQMGGVLYIRNTAGGVGKQGFAFPFTAIENDVGVEEFLIKTRLYLGSAVAKPRNLLIYPDVVYEHKVSGYGSRIFTPENKRDSFEEEPAEGEDNSLVVAFYTEDIGMTNIFEDPVFFACTKQHVHEEQYKHLNEVFDHIVNQHHQDYAHVLDATLQRPVTLSLGTMRTKVNGEWKQTVTNNGCMKKVDHPDLCHKINGVSFSGPTTTLASMMSKIFIDNSGG